MNKQYCVGVDIGGSHIACAIVDRASGEIVQNKIRESAINPNGTAGEIISTLNNTLATVFDQQEYSVQGVGIAMPGPFEYTRGISLIEGVGKFNSLYGINIKEEIRKILPDREFKVDFTNDASCFALGEYYAGAAKGSVRSLVVTIGTGFGSTFLVEGEIQQQAGEGVPPMGYLYCIPFDKSIADDYFSTRWFTSQWKSRTNRDVAGVKEIAQMALSGDAVAQSLFDEFADNLAAFIYPWLQQFKPDTFVIGGSIAKAAALFLDRMSNQLKERGIVQTAIQCCKLWEKAPIIGSAMSIKNLRGADMTNNRQLRKTEQFLAPEKAESTSQGNYDIYPGFPLGTGKIESGVESLAQWMSQHKTIIMDGYVGVFWDNLIQHLSDEFNKKKINVRWFHADAAMKSAEEISAMIQPYLGGDDPIFGKITDKKLMDWFDTDKLQKLQPDPNADINIVVGCGAALTGWKGALVYIDLPKNELQFRMRAQMANNLGADTFNDNRQMYKRFYFVDWPVLNEHKCNLLPAIDMLVDEQRPDILLSIGGKELRDGLQSMSRNFFRVRPWFEPGAWGGSWMKGHIQNLNKEVHNLAWSFELMVLENGLMFESDNYRLEVSFDFLMFNSYKDILGDCAERFRYDFPIRFDFLDTFDGGNLSVQCHPRPEYITEQFGMPFTQDETYYIMDCKGNADVYLGFQEGIDPDAFHQALKDSQQNVKALDIEKFVQKHPAKKHDLFLIPNGTIHASGSDNLVLEISSAPYIFTFKMYDWLRLDLDGRPRPINIEHGMNNLYFDRQGDKVQNELISHPCVLKETADCLIEHLPTHPKHFYDIHRYHFDNEVAITTDGKCHVWMLVEGSSVVIETGNGMKQRFNYAETFVIPAAAGSYKIVNEGKNRAMMVMSFVR